MSTERKVVERWADLVGFPAEHARDLQILMLRRHRQEMAAANGDPHPSSPNPKDKCENARVWKDLVDQTLDKIYDLITPHGFTFVCTGLWGSLKKGDNYVVDLPAPRE